MRIMMRLKIVFLLISIFFCFRASGQKNGQLVYYLKDSGQLVSTKDSAEYWMVVKTPDTAGKYPYSVYEYEKNGKLRLSTNAYTNDLKLKYDGHYTAYFPNGKTKALGMYENGDMRGRQMQFYPNGKLYCIITYDKQSIAYFGECRDSTGKVLTTSGYGDWKQFDDNFTKVIAEGQMVNGSQEGEWKFKISPSEKFTRTYKAGREVSSTEEPQSGHSQKDVYTSVDKPPVFPGGNERFPEYVQAHLKYPEASEQRRDHGQMVLSFVVEKDGSLSDIKILRSVSGLIDDAVLNVLKHSPKWKPGIKDDQPVRVMFSMPINFEL